MTEQNDFDYQRDHPHLLWQENNIVLDWSVGEKNHRENDYNLTVTTHMKSNGTVYAHVFFTRQGVMPDHPDRRTRIYRTFGG